ncbi:MAG: hypothetical protein Q9163_000502 [Psora crenata]
MAKHVARMDEMFKASSETSDAIRKSPWGATIDDSPFNFRFGLPTYQFYAKHPKKAARFAKAMAGLSQLDRQSSELRDEYPWERLTGKVIDVGGGSGHISISLAKDESDQMLAQGNPLLTAEVQDRVSYMKHNFFDPQPIHDASAFFIRQCLHNWPDQECVRILRAFVPALEKCKPGTPLLINDTVLPKLGEKSRFEDKALRQLDITMLVILNAKQRTEKEFHNLVKAADERYEVVKVHSAGSMGLVEVHLMH